MRVVSWCTVLVSIGVMTACTNSLPAPVARPVPQAGTRSFDEVLAQRRSVREFASTALTREEVLKLSWAAQGVTDSRGLRTAPSAGALYPLELYVVTFEGSFHYDPAGNVLTEHAAGDRRTALFEAALRQDAVREGAAIFVIAAVYERTRVKYGDGSERYVHMEAGHAAQNLLLEATALGLGAVPIGAFDDAGVQGALSLPEDHVPLYLIPVGHPRQQ